VEQESAINSEPIKTAQAHAETDRQASLGRYMLEVRHSLNNALTSILGNAELILLDPQSHSPNLRVQVETIHNMGMRINEILQRFTSLQKEMQLVEQQARKKMEENSAAAGR